MNLAIGLAAIWTALYFCGAIMEWLTQHDLLMPAFLMLVAAVAANALRAKLMGRMAMVAIAMLLAMPAFAHDHARADLTQWFKGLKSHKGYCCDGTDALHLRDVDWEVKDGHYRVKIPKTGADLVRAVAGDQVETIWADVPEDAVLDEPNRDGTTLVWPIYGYGGVNIRCFLPGSMT